MAKSKELIATSFGNPVSQERRSGVQSPEDLGTFPAMRNFSEKSGYSESDDSQMPKCKKDRGFRTQMEKPGDATRDNIPQISTKVPCKTDLHLEASPVGEESGGSERRASNEVLLDRRKQKKAAEKKLREELKSEGFDACGCRSQKNTKCQYGDVEEEKKARTEITTEQFKNIRSNLPVLLRRLSKIKDPRNPKKIKYGVSLLMIYGILMFVFQMSSRRETNRSMTTPMFIENLKMFIPELDSLPHCDTLARLLEKIDVHEIEDAHFDLIRSLIRKKKFSRYLVKGRYPIAVDGTKKFSRKWLWDENCLERKVGGDADSKDYIVYVLEASLAFGNSMTIPLTSVFLSYKEGFTDEEKQDCELKAFKRLCLLLKEQFKRLPIILLLDGLYPNGPVFEECRKRNWDFMIVLKDKSLKSVWEEYEGLKKLEPENECKMKVKDRMQSFRWVNDIEYFYGKGRCATIHVVVCRERWKEIDPETAEIVEKSSKHAWVSNLRLDRWNVHSRCNLAARKRWNIENQIQDEKCNGYNYSHCFAYDWNTMKGFHFLMNIGLAINVLSEYCVSLSDVFIEKGMQGFIRFIRETLSGPWLEKEKIDAELRKKYQMRLV